MHVSAAIAYGDDSAHASLHFTDCVAAMLHAFPSATVALHLPLLRAVSSRLPCSHPALLHRVASAAAPALTTPADPASSFPAIAMGLQSALLLVIDLQYGTVVGPASQGQEWGPRSNPLLEQTVQTVLQRWRQSKQPIIHIQHDSDNPADLLHAATHPDSYAIHPCAAPLAGETVLVKHRSSAFAGTPLHEQLQKQGIKELIIIGMDATACVQTTARQASDLDYKVTVVADATACYSDTWYDEPEGARMPVETVHRFAMTMLHPGFATVVSSKQLLSEL